MSDLGLRFWSKTERSGDCWIWTGELNSYGYGRFRVNGRRVAAHRLAYTDARGPIPEGLQLDHLCRVRSCVRPEHLEPVTSQTNTLRGEGLPAINARKTHCNSGHPFSAENTHVLPNGDRTCRTCKRAINRAWRARRSLTRVTA